MNTNPRSRVEATAAPAGLTSGERPALIACVDGPMAGQWYTLADWTSRQDAAARMRARYQPATAIDAYQPTDQVLTNPRHHDLTGTAWTTSTTDTDSTDDYGYDVDLDDDGDDGWVW